MLLVAAIVGLLVLPEPWGAVAVAAAAVVEVGEVYLWIRFLRRYRVTTGAEGLIGAPAQVLEECAPDGLVRARGEIWAASSQTPAAAGQRVRVVAVERLRLLVEPESGTEKGPGGGP